MGEVDRNKYQFTSHIYDLDERPIVKDDIPFYLEYAKQAGGEIMELACGTGRVTIPLARAGHRVTGFDLSTDMLNRLQDKLDNEDEEVRNRLNFCQADMTDFQFDQQYPLIIVPFRAFQLLTEEEQCRACLSRVRNHLTDEGLFIINVFKPYTVLDETWVQPEEDDWIKVDPKSGKKVRRTAIKRRIDLDNQIIYPELLYYVEESKGNEKVHVEKLAMKYYYEEQLRDLLTSSNFKIVNEYGYYDKRPIAEGAELIFVCKK